VEKVVEEERLGPERGTAGYDAGTVWG